MLFMSPEHVEAMNAVLEAEATVRAACEQLNRPHILAYELADGPEGETVFWGVSFTDTVRFSLGPVSQPDLTLTGDWTRMVRASRANRAGKALDPGVVPVGDLEVLGRVGPVLALASTVATLSVDFPDV